MGFYSRAACCQCSVPARGSPGTNTRQQSKLVRRRFAYSLLLRRRNSDSPKSASQPIQRGKDTTENLYFVPFFSAALQENQERERENERISQRPGPGSTRRESKREHLRLYLAWLRDGNLLGLLCMSVHLCSYASFYDPSLPIHREADGRCWCCFSHTDSIATFSVWAWDSCAQEASTTTRGCCEGVYAITRFRPLSWDPRTHGTGTGMVRFCLPFFVFSQPLSFISSFFRSVRLGSLQTDRVALCGVLPFDRQRLKMILQLFD